jgi:dTDP-4-dehydrorhamnose reductase
MRILVLGVSGVLGSAILRVLAQGQRHEVFGSARSAWVKNFFPPELAGNIITGIDVESADILTRLFSKVQPDMVINCVGLVKQLAEADDPLFALPINSLLPHRLGRLCELARARLVHFSTDCVFSGKKGGYVENDVPDAMDLYGRSKLLGEVDYPHAITLRTSLIGHELNGARSLVNWFLAQEGIVRGFTKAIFSGLPTVEIARVIEEYVLPHPELRGVYHLSANPISKHDLLSMVKDVYGKQIEIIPDDSLVIDRSLDSSRFCHTTGFASKPWPDLVKAMHDFG